MTAPRRQRISPWAAGLAALFAALSCGARAAVTISSPGAGAFEVSLAADKGGFVAAWHDSRGGREALYMRLLSSDGRPAGPEHRLTDGSQRAYEPDAAVVGRQLQLAWYEKDDAGHLTARVGAWTFDGQPLWMRTLSGARDNETRNPIVRAAGGKLFCAWLQYGNGRKPAVWFRWYDLHGNALSRPERAAAAAFTTWNLNAAVSANEIYLVFDARVDTRAKELYLVRIHGRTAKTVRLTADDGFDSVYPDVAVRHGRAALTWFDQRDGNKEVYLYAAPAAELGRHTLDAAEIRVTHTPGNSIGAYLAWNGGRIGLAWCDDSVGQAEIYFEDFDSSGAALEPPQRLTHNPTRSLIPAIVPAADGFALAWNEWLPNANDPHSSGRSAAAFALVTPRVPLQKNLAKRPGG